VGYYFDSSNNQHGFLDSGGTFTTIDAPQAVDGTAVTGINNSGQIVGNYADADGKGHGFIDDEGAFTTIDDPAATNGTSVQGINDAGEIVGYYIDAEGTHGFSAEVACEVDPNRGTRGR
jgi:uncharacterized membrane protein